VSTYARIHYLLSNYPVDDLRTIISGPEMAQKFVAMLDSDTLSEQRSALLALTVLLEDGELLHLHIRCMIRIAADPLRAAYAKVETVHKILAVPMQDKGQFMSYFPSDDDRQVTLNTINICLKHSEHLHSHPLPIAQLPPRRPPYHDFRA
jgi:hypothetical protein